MASSDQMRAAWARRPDDELLHAHFLEELSAEGRRVVAELVIAKVGDIDAYVQRFADLQGEAVATLPVRGCNVAFEAKQRDLPLMYGSVVLTTHGIGFVPGGHDDELDGGDGLGGGGLGGSGLRVDLRFGAAFGSSLVGRAGGSVLSSMKQTSHPVANLESIALPVPLIAHLDPNALWFPHGQFDAVQWGADFGEVLRAGERLFSVEATDDAEPFVVAWAAAHAVPLSALDASPLLR